MIESIVGIVLALFAALFAIWLLVMDIRFEQDERKQAEKQVMRQEKKAENAEWYAKTREQLDREQLFRDYTRTK